MTEYMTNVVVVILRNCRADIATEWCATIVQWLLVVGSQTRKHSVARGEQAAPCCGVRNLTNWRVLNDRLVSKHGSIRQRHAPVVTRHHHFATLRFDDRDDNLMLNAMVCVESRSLELDHCEAAVDKWIKAYLAR